MQAEIVCIGTELLLGKIVNTNAAYLSKKLAALGIDLFYQTTIGDNPVRLYTALKRAMHRSDIVIATGGLGPTVDDRTLEVIAQVSQKRLILSHAVLKDIKSHFQKRHISMPKNNIRQALIPEGAQALKNEVGTAPGLIIRYENLPPHPRGVVGEGKKMKGKVLIALPGVPAEMKPMVERDVLGYLAKSFAGNWVIVWRAIRTTGLAESQVNQRVKDILNLKPPLTVGIYAHTEGVDLNITAKAKNSRQAERLIAPVERKLRSRLKEYIYGKDNQTLEEVVAQGLTKAKKTIAVAESCTGGFISQRLTNISGSSRYFVSGIVAYSDQIKQSLLDIAPETLKKSAAVSKEAACLMAKNIKQSAQTDLGLGVTGIAGPTGATQEKPVGLVYIALATPRKVQCKQFHFHGDRAAVRLRASQAALDMVRRYLT